MESNISVHVPTSLFIELTDFLRANKDPRDPVAMVSVAIEYWLQNASAKPRDLLTHTDSKGYQWKTLFLPEGTQIRMQYKGAYSYARVEGDQVIYNGNPITPSKLANTIAGTSRNAWHDLWIKFPDEKEWKLAVDHRRGTNENVDQMLQELGIQSKPDVDRMLGELGIQNKPADQGN